MKVSRTVSVRLVQAGNAMNQELSQAIQIIRCHPCRALFHLAFATTPLLLPSLATRDGLPDSERYLDNGADH